jgi:hypothetical protein
MYFLGVGGDFNLTQSSLVFLIVFCQSFPSPAIDGAPILNVGRSGRPLARVSLLYRSCIPNTSAAN